VITLQWKQHITNDFGWQAEVEDKSHKMLYNKDYFEHAPLALKSKTVVVGKPPVNCVL
jgi:hypothetical protein